MGSIGGGAVISKPVGVKLVASDKVRIPGKVSLAMPVFNGEQFIAEAIRSILAQERVDLELIITDNASTDATQSICKVFTKEDPRVRYVRNRNNLGAAPNYNLGFKLSTGEYVKWCAHDDVIEPGYVAACVAALEADAKATLAFGRTLCIDPDGRIFTGVDAEETPSILDDDPATRFYRALTLGGTCFPIFGVFRASALARSTLHRSYYGSDRALIAETALLGKVLRVEETVFYNREHPHRSIRIENHAERSRWQDTAASSRKASMERTSLFLHLMEIAGRHREVISPFAGRAKVLRFMAQPVEVGRMGLEIVRFVSPNAASNLRRLVRSSG